jgi:hypothetical protein
MNKNWGRHEQSFVLMYKTESQHFLITSNNDGDDDGIKDFK